MRRIPAIAAFVAVLVVAHMLPAQTRMTPTAPGTRGDPQWQGVLRHKDGRTFVTDGGLAIDAALARPATLPQKEYPSKLLETYFSASHRDECGLDDLRRNPSGTTYTSPTGLALNATYVDFLRRIVPPHSLRFRMTDGTRPILVAADGKTVGVLMPVAQ